MLCVLKLGIGLEKAPRKNPLALAYFSFKRLEVRPGSYSVLLELGAPDLVELDLARLRLHSELSDLDGSQWQKAAVSANPDVCAMLKTNKILLTNRRAQQRGLQQGAAAGFRLHGLLPIRWSKLEHVFGRPRRQPNNEAGFSGSVPRILFLARWTLWARMRDCVSC